MPDEDRRKPPTTRKRKLPYRFQGLSTWKQWLEQPPYADQVFADTATTVDLSGTQITVSEGHLWPPRKSVGLQDVGGDFFSQKSYFEPGHKPVTRTIRKPYGIPDWYNNAAFSGYILPVNVQAPEFAFPPALSSSNDDLDEYGATAISRCKPTNSPADLSTALGELLKEGIPSMIGSQFWKKRSVSAKQAGSEYLGVQFGWMPLVSEIRKVSEAITNSDKLLAQYERDAGKVVRRSYRFPSETDRSESVYLPDTPAWAVNAGSIFYQGGTLGDVVRVREKTQSRWFSGAFTYYLPSDYDSRNRLKALNSRAKVLLGTDLTPETLWNLAPWSWAADWFSNTGDVISNVTDFLSGGLVMRYGYIMEHTIVRDTYTITSSGLSPDIGVFDVPDLVAVTETKIRRAANPFGFGVSWDGLSPFQTSILVALGISRRG